MPWLVFFVQYLQFDHKMSKEWEHVSISEALHLPNRHMWRHAQFLKFHILVIIKVVYMCNKRSDLLNLWKIIHLVKFKKNSPNPCHNVFFSGNKNAPVSTFVVNISFTLDNGALHECDLDNFLVFPDFLFNSSTRVLASIWEKILENSSISKSSILESLLITLHRGDFMYNRFSLTVWLAS